MKRFQSLFAFGLLLLLLPVWRLLDYTVFLWPSSLIYTLFFAGVASCLICLPLSLLFNTKKWAWPTLFTLLCLLSYLATPLSRMATIHPELSHCGQLTYTGFFYPISNLLSEAYSDDLTARNQLCWLRKLLVQAPVSFTNLEDQRRYLQLLDKRLLSPPDKFMASLPMIALLYGHIAARVQGDMIDNVRSGRFFLNSLHTWQGHYTVEISRKDYGFFDWPLSAWIKMEYGLIEDNWQSIVENIKIEGD